MIPASYRTQIDLNPGEYRLELAITDGEKFGRATTSFKLDDVVKDGFSISGIALCNRYRQASVGHRPPTQAPRYVPLVSNGIEFTPAGDTRFHKGKPIISYFQIYGNQLENSSVILHQQVKVTDANTRQVRLDSGVEPLKLSAPPENGTATVVRNVSIETLPPGRYCLETQVSDSDGHKTVWSSTAFTVE